MFSVTGIVFDLDGTLVSSSHDYGEMNRRIGEILLNAGIDPNILNQPGLIWRVTRGGKDSMVDLGLTAENRLKISKKITEALNAVEILSLKTVEVIPTAFETLDYLSSEGLAIGIATRACEAYSREALKKTKLEGFIDVLLARDMVENPKPDPRHLWKVLDALSVERYEAVYVGDTTTDLRTAKSANVSFIGYIRNLRWAERLREEGCDAEIRDLSELKNIIKRKEDLSSPRVNSWR